ncbi:MAG: hypothetical protein ACK5LK_00735, partial [Chthoniobacterales bacterium]
IIAGEYTFCGPLLFNDKPIKKWDMGIFQDDDGNRWNLMLKEKYLCRKSIAADGRDLASMEPYQDNRRSTYHGRAQAIVQSTDKPGTIQVVLKADGLPNEKVIIQVGDK